MISEDVLTRSLRKALTSPVSGSELTKDHVGQPAHIPYPVTSKPKWRPGSDVQANPHGAVEDDDAFSSEKPLKKGGSTVGGESSVDGSATPDPFSEQSMKKMEGCGCGGEQGMTKPHTPALEKADKPKPKETDDENAEGHQGPVDGKSKSAGDGGAPEDKEEKPQEGFDAEGQPGQMPQAMDGQQPVQMGQTGLETHPTQMGPGQPEAQTSMPPGMTPMLGPSLGAMLLGECTPEELDALALAVLSLKKDGAAGGSPLTTGTPGASQARMGPTPKRM